MKWKEKKTRKMEHVELCLRWRLYWWTSVLVALDSLVQDTINPAYLELPALARAANAPMLRQCADMKEKLQGQVTYYIWPLSPDISPLSSSSLCFLCTCYFISWILIYIGPSLSFFCRSPLLSTLVFWWCEFSLDDCILFLARSRAFVCRRRLYGCSCCLRLLGSRGYFFAPSGL